MERQNGFHRGNTARNSDVDHSDEGGAVCALVLAGGEGKRLQPYIKSLGKGELPKQYVNFVGTRSMLEHTLARRKTGSLGACIYHCHRGALETSRSQRTTFPQI